jgi:uncharacterized DUF497 family protein
MKLSSTAFDWDGANREKCRKHGVSQMEIETLLSGEPRIAPDLKHSALEDRFIAVGRNGEGRPLFVAFTFRMHGESKRIRPVSARYMHEKEAKAFEKKSP